MNIDGSGVAISTQASLVRTGKDQLLPLTSIRFFAAAFIVAFHLTGVWGLPYAESIGWYFGVGVDLFFVLSGFILAYTYDRVEDARTGLRLVLYRLARIVPLHWAMMLAWALFAYDPSQPPIWSGETAAALLLVQAWAADFRTLFAGNSVSWTLSVELFFYLCLPLLLFVGNIGIVLLAVLASGLTIWWAGLEGGAGAAAIIQTSPGAFMVHFAGGMLLARLFVLRHWQIAKKWATALELAAVCLATAYIFGNQHVAPAVARWVRSDAYAVSWAPRLVALLAFAPLIFILAVGRGHVSGLLRQRPLVLLGEISFATYLVHMVLLKQMMRWDWFPLPSFWLIGTYVALTYGLSLALHRLVELPSNRWLRHQIDRLLPR